MEDARDLELMIDEVNAFLENPPALGTAEHRRFEDLIHALDDHRSAAAGPFAEPLRQLGGRIDALVLRRDVERRARDVSPGEDGMTPTLGFHFPPD